MAPIDSYDHYLVARQAVQDQATDRLTPTEDQKIILIIIGVYTAAILVLWNMPIAKIILSPFKVSDKKSGDSSTAPLIHLFCTLCMA
jgi:hypothetical protein